MLLYIIVRWKMINQNNLNQFLSYYNKQIMKVSKESQDMNILLLLIFIVKTVQAKYIYIHFIFKSILIIK
jgi:hypothetical protein